MPSRTLEITSERVDELPILLEFAKQMGVAGKRSQGSLGKSAGLSEPREIGGLAGEVALQRSD